jgi:uncharacterized membrane protein YkgB
MISINHMVPDMISLSKLSIRLTSNGYFLLIDILSYFTSQATLSFLIYCPDVLSILLYISIYVINEWHMFILRGGEFYAQRNFR